MKAALVLAAALALASPAAGHDWFGDKFIQVASEWAQYGGYGGPGGMYQTEPPPPLRDGEEWLGGKAQVFGNNGSCCDGKDCWEIEDTDWWEENGLYRVKRDGKVYSILTGHAQPSESKKGKAAACIHNGEILCFFLPVTY